MTFVRAQTQPPEDVEIHTVDDVFIKQLYIAEAGTFIPQHSHVYAHTSMLAVGAVRIWKDRELLGDFMAPVGIVIPARTKHTFLALVPGTIIYCIHNISRLGQVEIAEEHQLVQGG